ncbi:MAG: toll/interleukin-1 receptor domain-containing protein [Candidatus Thiosymbion ectosymbiont of Robbea hypermnestra]|nr:toll/interleukin-1 receptor domain-containing protein [Candidatus Thiosymbion ectosymbiont of Robbea hypermnestra]
MDASGLTPQVFISHSSVDTWVAKQVAMHVSSCEAGTFLDESDIAYGDDFEHEIIAAAEESTELLVLLTPWATDRPYIWMEIGLFLRDRKRIVGILYGLTPEDISTDKRIPALLKRIELVEINRLDGYFEQLKKRVAKREVADV